MTVSLEADSLIKRYGAVEAVRSLSLKVAAGEVLGLLGPNGAGKTTTLRMLTGYLRPTAGRALVNGLDVWADPLAARRALGYLPEGAPLYTEMAVEPFLRFCAAARGLDRAAARAAIGSIIDRLALGRVRSQGIDTLSKGFRRRVGLAQAVMHDPSALVLDEPTDGLDPNQKQAVRDLIAGLRPGRAIIVSTHILEEVEAMCSRVVIVDRGRIVADGTPEQLRAKSRYAHAVTLTFPIAAAVGAVTNGWRHELRTLPDGRVQVTLLSPDGASFLDAVRQRLSDLKVVPLDLVVEAGRLDDVFRALTHAEEDAA